MNGQYNNYISNPGFGNTFQNNQQPTREPTPAPPPDDFNDDLDFSNFPDFDYPLYCFPGPNSQTMDVFSQPPSPQEQQPTASINEIRFSSLHALRGYIETSGINLNDYVIVMPANKYRSLRYDKRPSHANKCEFIMARVPK